MIRRVHAGARILALGFGLATACMPSDDAADDAGGDPDGPGLRFAPDFPVPTGPCEIDAFAPTRLLLTTTDFSTGALSVLDLATETLATDVATGSSDAVPFVVGEAVVVAHRFGIDRIDVLDPSDWSLSAQIAVPPRTDVVSTNPHAVVRGAEGHLLVTAFGEPRLVELDPTAPPAAAVVADIDLGPVADDDGNPEASLAVACGDRVYVMTERLDESFRPRGDDAWIAVDASARTLLDADARQEGVQGLRTLGTWVRQVRRDPADPSGHTLLGLSTGIERIELDAGQVTWAVPASRFVLAGAEGFLQPQAFDLDDAGTRAYVAMYDADFSQVRLYVVGLDGHAPEIPQAFAGGFDSVEHTLEVVGDTLWYGSTRSDAPGLWRFDLAVDPPADDGEVRSTGLPPFSMVPLP